MMRKVLTSLKWNIFRSFRSALIQIIKPSPVPVSTVPTYFRLSEPAKETMFPGLRLVQICSGCFLPEPRSIIATPDLPQTAPH